jgi:hypothetical protein
MSGNRVVPLDNQKIVQERGQLQDSSERKRGWNPLGWWYRLSAPGEESEYLKHEIIRRSRLASILLLLTLIVVIAFVPAALTSDDLHVVPPLIVMFLVACTAVAFNKRGKVVIVGIMLIVTFDFALIFTLLSYPHATLTQNAVPIYDLFVLSDIIAVSLLPASSILYVAIFHSIFMCADIALQPHTPDLQYLVTSTGYSFMIRPLTIQIVVGLVMYLWVRNTIKALERADKAELIAELERTIALQKKDLDEGIQQILQTLVRAANGDLKSRAPLARENVLWQVGISLNTLLSRLQRSSQNERELQRIRSELERLIYAVRESKEKRSALWIMPGGTELDPLISELLSCSFVQSPTGPRRRS